MSDDTYYALEDAIRQHVADVTEGNIATDWVLLTASVGAAPDETLYVDACSETAAHSIEGLLHRGLRRAIEPDDEDAESSE